MSTDWLWLVQVATIGSAFVLGFVLGIARGKQIAAHRIDEILSRSKGWR